MGYITVLWKITPLFAEWLSAPSNILFQTSVLSSTSAILELGCGTSGLIALVAAPKVCRYTLTDQAYVSKVLTSNLSANSGSGSGSGAAAKSKQPSSSGKKKSQKTTPKEDDKGETASFYGADKNITFAPLDWERDLPTASLTSHPGIKSFDSVIACDCVYNEALVKPLVTTCAEACKLRVSNGDGDDGGRPTVCIVAQQLRDPDVFGAWMEAFWKRFRTWRVSGKLVRGMGEGSGFVVHVGVLRGSG